MGVSSSAVLPPREESKAVPNLKQIIIADRNVNSAGFEER
jgi:hypothetical protein